MMSERAGIAELLTAQQVATRLQISRSAAHKLIQRLSPGTRRHIPAAVLDDFIMRGGDRAWPAEQHTYVVAAWSTGLVKIGQTTNWDKRWRSLCAGSPVPLELVALLSGLALEKTLHRLFAQHRRHFEWFDAAPVLEWLRIEKHVDG
jgi:hypothetical protein